MARRRISPGGVGDGLPAEPDGSPLLARWFAIAMVLLTVAGIGVTVLAVSSIRSTEIEPAARRPPGDAQVTHFRGQAVLNEDRTEEDGVGCAPDVRLVGDEGARSTVRRALNTLCSLVDRDRDGLSMVAAGLQELDAARGVVRIAVFEVNGLDSSTRIEDGVPVVELNPKFQFDDASLAAPFLGHELVHLAQPTWPGQAIDAVAALEALQAQDRLCGLLVLPDDPPRGCSDAAAVLAEDDPLQALRDAGYEG